MSPMIKRSSSEIREMFLKYFEGHGCRRMKSASLVPDDPTLLFTVAGMVPFKPYFLGLKTPDVTRVTTSQKCIRTNDIENVGRTARHHTFFEMLGNFSFGDYFKAEIIPWAWEFLTDHIGLDRDRLYATIYLDDDEAHDIWRSVVGLPEDRIVRLGDDDNFWAAGPVGPCGPCSEIIYDQGPEFSCGKPTCGVGCDCDRYLEIWNLVFMQYSRDESGKLTPLPKKNIDTGMGLERISSVVQGVHGNFDTDLFRPIIDRACELSGARYGESAKTDMAVRVISDHLRASAFMIADGVLPSNEGPGYVLRRLIRRSVRYGRLLGLDRPFLLELLPKVNEIMAGAYDELIKQKSTIEQILSSEEERFGNTLSQGIELLETEMKKLESAKGSELPGDVAFHLYDTYGFPLELTEEICAEAGLKVGHKLFDEEMDRQRDRARKSSKQAAAVIKKNVYTELADKHGATAFDGYELLREDATVLSLIRDDAEVDEIAAGDEAALLLDRTPFYAERGGQIGDKGVLTVGDAKFEVEDTTHPSGDLIVHKGRLVSGTIRAGMKVDAAVDEERRRQVARHHTATHLLHEALSRVLGSHVRQAGSLVTPTFLRFDYNHFSPMTDEQIEQVERIMSEQIMRAAPVVTNVMNIDDAKDSGAKALFEEKYGDVVRVVKVEGYSTELCGGTHVKNTGEIGLVKIIRDEGIGSGVRRINAVVGSTALAVFQNMASTLNSLTDILGADLETVYSKAEEILDEKKVLQKKTQSLLLSSVLASIGDRRKDAKRVGDTVVFADDYGEIPKDMLRQIGDAIKKLEPNCVIVMASTDGGSVSLIAMASDSAVSAGANAGKLVKDISAMISGSGGGRPTMGQGGGKDIAKLDSALEKVEEMVRAQLGA